MIADRTEGKWIDPFAGVFARLAGCRTPVHFDVPFRHCTIEFVA